jgi:diguanylate cyclase (GGDEF)-like protein
MNSTKAILETAQKNHQVHQAELEKDRQITPDYVEFHELMELQNNQVLLVQRRMALLAELELFESSTMNIKRTLKRICEIAAQLLPATGGVSIILWDSEHELFQVAATTVPNQSPEEVVQKIRTSGGATRWVVDNAADIIVPDIKDDPFRANSLLQTYQQKGYVGTPIQFEHQVLGVLYCLSQEVLQLAPDDLDFLHILARRAGAAIRLTQHFADMYEHATTDALTGLSNRRLLQQFGQLALARHKRSQSNFTVISLDLDSFKNINDTYGHPTGDGVLQQTARVLLENSRHGDVIARFGGEEFMLILPETKQSQAKQVAERIRKAIANTPHETSKGQIQVTASFGIASGIPSAAWQLEDYFATADQAMYQAKRRGKNRVSSKKMT